MPDIVEKTLELKDDIVDIASEIAQQDNALFLGRGMFYPIAKEGALKLKEISYIHAEAYPAGELKHGPLALIDEHMPVVAIAPEHELAEKLVSNLEEVKARGGALYVFGNAKEKLSLERGKIHQHARVRFFTNANFIYDSSANFILRSCTNQRN
nr:MAG: hypothetical protein CM15mP61_01310 [Gammaproteobacteria bacterium]